MTDEKTLIISLYNWDSDKNCFADITLPISGTRITGFKVRQGSGGGIMVHEPSGMGTTWSYSEIEWPEVRKQITAEYHKEADKLKASSNSYNNQIEVKLHDFDEKNRCLADVTLKDQGVVINDFKAMPGTGGGVSVYMPKWMRMRWSYTEVKWRDVCDAIIEKYKKAIVERNSLNAVRKETAGNEICTFYSFFKKTYANADVTIRSSGEQIKDLPLIYEADRDAIQVIIPRRMNENRNISGMGWDELKENIQYEFRKQILQEPVSRPTDQVSVSFNNIQKTMTCFADVKLPHKNNVMKDFLIKKDIDTGRVNVSTPKWMGRWNDREISWHALSTLITEEFDKYEKKQSLPQNNSSNQAHEPVSSSILNGNNIPEENEQKQENTNKQERETNELGRVKNAINSSFVFYPRTVLRSIPSSVDNKGSLFSLVTALNKGSIGGLGPYEINILEWIAKLRYVTSTMLLDLTKAGYVTYGWRTSVTGAKLSRIINRMAEYKLITLTRFITLNEDKSEDNTKHSAMRIITLGANGNILLRSLSKNMIRYSQFDIFQDGNTVKRYLTSNQWLIYWLSRYKNEIGESYDTNYVVNFKGADNIGAKIYASVTVNDCTMIAEPVRRVEEFEIESNKKQLREKIQRLSLIFGNLDQLYVGQDEISFSKRPVIILICEDDDHIHEVLDSIQVILPEIRDQEIWLTTDLRVFNDNKRGERFLHIVDNSIQPVNLYEAIGVDNEA